MQYVQGRAEPATLKIFPSDINNRNQTMLLKSLSVEKNENIEIFADISIPMQALIKKFVKMTKKYRSQPTQFKFLNSVFSF